MSRDQINELKTDLDTMVGNSSQLKAEKLYAKGWRKQEWISVAERNPSESGKYLVCTINGKVYQTKFYSYPENKGGHWGQKDKGRTITHWMPLPEPPKMKGGAEL